MVAFHEDLFHGGLFHIEIFLIFHGPGHALLVFPFIGLSAERLHRRAFGGVEQTHLDLSGIGIDAHLAAEGVDLPYHMALGGPAHAGVTGHESDMVEAQRQQKGLHAQPRRGQRRFDAGMAAADDDNIVISCEICVHDFTFLYKIPRRCGPAPPWKYFLR